MDMHEEAILDLQAALKYIDPDEPSAVHARLPYAIAQVSGVSGAVGSQIQR